MKKLALITASLCLSACTAIPLKTMYRLATTDPLQLDPQALRTATRMPDWIAPRTDGAKLIITSQAEGKLEQKETFILQAIPLALEQKDLALEAKSGFNLYVYRINPADLPRLEAFRTNTKALKAAGVKVKGNLGISVDACRQVVLPEGKIPVTNYLRLDDSGYMPLVVDYDLRQEVDGTNLAELLPPC